MELMENPQWHVFSGSKMVEYSGDLGSCDLVAKKMASATQSSALEDDGQSLAAAGLQEGRITADCLEPLKTDVERR